MWQKHRGRLQVLAYSLSQNYFNFKFCQTKIVIYFHVPQIKKFGKHEYKFVVHKK